MGRIPGQEPIVSFKSTLESSFEQRSGGGLVAARAKQSSTLDQDPTLSRAGRRRLREEKLTLWEAATQTLDPRELSQNPCPIIRGPIDIKQHTEPRFTQLEVVEVPHVTPTTRHARVLPMRLALAAQPPTFPREDA